MDDKKLFSHSQLKKFINDHKLQNNRSLIYFKAVVDIQTEMQKLEDVEAEVMVNFDVYGHSAKVNLSCDLDPNLYPGNFYPTYDDMQHVDEEFLRITGEHTRNSKVGKYIIDIYPREKIYGDV